MPQFDATTFLPQIFWLGVCFVSLLLFSAYVSLPALERVLKVRWKSIEGTLEEAERLQKEAEGLVASLEAELTTARRKAHHDVLEAAQTASHELTQRKFALAQLHKQRFRDSERVILQKKATTMGYVQDIATEVAGAFTQVLLSHPINQASIQEAVEDRVEREKRTHAL
ncbi:MAG: hypothetical protein C0514_03335 [Candidatus Puniceispirillum sp.]|nr:hypothetical protein [Candidatus Puniceispirillum sp.]